MFATTVMSAAVLLLALAQTSAQKVVGGGGRSEEQYIKMRDGVKLHTRITYPRNFDASTSTATVVMDRSPYGQFGIELLADLFVPAGFISVCQVSGWVCSVVYECCSVLVVASVTTYLSARQSNRSNL
jgi:hypothetical protein